MKPAGLLNARSTPGLRWSGDLTPDAGGVVAPLFIPPGVSIQGTSALDTIVDARGQRTSIFVIGLITGSIAGDYGSTFIDALTIRGARGFFRDAGPRDGAGILIHGSEPAASPSISNCFITDNTVGIAIVDDSADHSSVHSPTIANNTFVWNEVGLWNGSRHPGPVSQLREGFNLPALLNNLFDTATPSSGIRPGQLIGASAFEGLAAADTSVTLVAGGTIDSNAYEVATSLPRFDIGNTMPAPPYTWPRTISRVDATGMFLPLPGSPTVDVAPFTNPASAFGQPSPARGGIYIADVFRIDSTTHDPAGTPRSRHDFRIAPMAVLPPLGPTSPTPLINAGVDPVNAVAALNGTPFNLGLPPNAEEEATLTATDWDCDGAFNLRVARKDFVAPGPNGLIDIGADELGAVVISGYLDSTRMFSRSRTTQPGPGADRVRLFFFNLFLEDVVAFPRPQFGFALDFARVTPTAGVTSEWYDQLLNHPYTVTPNTGNYTDGRFDASVQLRFSLAGSLTNPFFMRNLHCDIAPHLYHAIDPDLQNPDMWVPTWGRTGSFSDPFHSNPWYNNTSQVSAENNRLYFASTMTQLRLGIVSPPKTVVPGDISAAPLSFLFRNSAFPTNVLIQPYDFSGQNDFLYSVNAFGWGDSSTGAEQVPFMPSQEWQGLRVTLELLDPDNPQWPNLGNPQNNIQTALVVQGAGGGAPEFPFEVEETSSGELGMTSATQSWLEARNFRSHSSFEALVRRTRK